MIRKLLACTLLAVAGPALAVDGFLDTSFGIFSSGRNLVAIDQGGFNLDTLAKTLVAQDGSIFLIGTSTTSQSVSRFSITRMLPNGIVDLSFGNSGTVLSTESNVQAASARFDASGNILIAGRIKQSGTDTDFYLCRFSQQGQPVQFSAAGYHCVDAAFNIAGGNKTDTVNDILLEADGKIVLAGTAGVGTNEDRGAMVRFNADGSRDGAFGTSGKRAYAFTVGKVNRFNAIARLSDGKYVLVGESGDAASADGTSALFARIKPDGTPDNSFHGGTGYALWQVNSGPTSNRDEAAVAIKVLGDGSMLMAGNAQSGANDDQSLIFVYKLAAGNGALLEQGFGNNGLALYVDGYSLALGDMLVQSDGKAVLIATTRLTAALSRQIQVLRTDLDGTMDALDFGSTGRSNITFNLPGLQDYGLSGAFQSGRIIVAGHSLNTAPSNYDMNVSRLSNDLIFADGLD